MEERGSSKWLRDRELPEEEIDRLWGVLDEHPDLRLVHWWIKGQPAIDDLVGHVRIPITSAPEVVASLFEFQALRLRLDLFPYGQPVPDEILVSFRHAGRLH
jgi:hypothetical protein